MVKQVIPRYEAVQPVNTGILLAEDFDGTVARTFEKPPSGIGVLEAYEHAVEAVFDTTTLQRYIDNGGLKNRAPSEVVADLAPGAEGKELDILVTQLIQVKLQVLMGQIGTRLPGGGMWPRPTDGYLELVKQIEDARETQPRVTEAILSSGHEPFIEATYDAWGVRRPEHIVAVETIDRLHPDKDIVKPSPELIKVLYDLWQQGIGREPADTPSHEDLANMLYVGDDNRKDGDMARAFGVDFVLLDPERSEEVWQGVGDRILGRAALTGAQQRV